MLCQTLKNCKERDKSPDTDHDQRKGVLKIKDLNKVKKEEEKVESHRNQTKPIEKKTRV